MKSNTLCDSPKTPGGISKSLLTPCRRLGLSRKYKAKGPSPFVSPLSSATNDPEDDGSVEISRKRKKADVDNLDKQFLKDKVCVSDDDFNVETGSPSNLCMTDTPRRLPSLSRKTLRQKKTNNVVNAGDSNKSPKYETINNNVKGYKHSLNKTPNEQTNVENSMKSLDMLSKIEPLKNTIHNGTAREYSPLKECSDNQNIVNMKSSPSPKCPNLNQNKVNDLTKECLVVLQKKIFKANTQDLENINQWKDTKNSQTLFDSDSDDLPLSKLNVKSFEDKVNEKKEVKNDNANANHSKCNTKRSEDIQMLTGFSTVSKDKLQGKNIRQSTKFAKNTENYNSLEDDDDDDDFMNSKKRTIIIRKTYDKTKKPIKSKSTGSITQKDIDELRAKVESKKKLLLAQAMTKETEELRALIKKWQKGCQDALMELMELMKNKLPDQENMDYSEILKTLKIPHNLVGYDSENDLFSTPNDESVIFAKFSNL